MGVVKADSVKWVPKSTKLSFQLTDEQSYELNVEYTGAKPDMFREGQGVVVEGKLSDTQSLVANALLVKHNEDYSATDHKKQKEDYTKSLQQ